MKKNLYPSIKLHFSNSEDTGFSYPWCMKGNIYVKGYAYSGKSILMGDDLADLFSSAINQPSFDIILKNLNGYFAVIIDLESEVYAAVDRVCSTPLLFRISSAIEIGDNFRPFLRRGDEICLSSAQQYLASGYTFGEGTLLSEVKNIPAGSILCVNKSTGVTNVCSYYRYIQNPQICDRSEKSLLEQLHEVHCSVFERLVSTLDGRQAVVPLSGGYDSRLIIEMLHHFKHKNVLCVTWGSEDYWQVGIAQSVANRYKFPWARVNATLADWFEWHTSGAMQAELELCGALSSIPYVQDNLVFDFLKKNNLLQDDAIFLSGNSGDFIEGGHILGSGVADSTTLLSKIKERHMRLTPLKDLKGALEGINKDIDKFSFEMGSLDGFDEYWEWKERQSKFVSKSIKPFEARGFEWRMPFWDLELMNFWAAVPREVKAGRRLFYAYAEQFMDGHTMKANPDLSVVRRYSDVLSDGRYGIFLASDSHAASMLQSNYSLLDDYLKKIVRIRPLRLSRINGLLALSVCRMVLNATSK